MSELLAPKYLVAALLLVSAVFVHFRGRVRHGFFRQLTDHSTFLAPYNAFMYLFSAVPPKPYLDVVQFPDLRVLQDNWEAIRDEALALQQEGEIKAAATYNDLGFNSFFRTGWKRFYLKWYDDYLPSARAKCPRTVALLEQVPSVTAAMFALLPPDGRLVRHRDPFGGSLRYHLGLATPNSPECCIYVDGERYFWRDGEAVMFDETYIHYAENKTDRQRIILFCDVERPLTSRFARSVNRWVSRHLVKASATQNVAGEKVGALNRVFGTVYRVRLLGKRIKRWNRGVYYALKWLLIGGLLYLIFA
ncbi:MAG: aspartyl/asparaginyl beta-hydroxylase domain-containing protein [Pseudomonadota bacterium]